MKRGRARGGDERGSAILLAVISLTALLGAAALAVDVGLLLSARSEAQSAADAAALAGASAFVDGGDGAASEARERALLYATRNPVLGDFLHREAVDVQIDPAASRVRVSIVRPVTETWFARVLSAEQLAIRAEAVAVAGEVAETRCVRPFSLTVPASSEEGDPPQPAFSVGERIPLWSTGQDGEATLWDMPDRAGWSGSCSTPGTGGRGSGPAIRKNICMCNNSPVAKGSKQRRMNGKHAGPVSQGWDGLFDQDPSASWDPVAKRVVGSRYENWRESPRIVVLPVHTPQGGNDLRFAGFIQAFVESPDGNSVFGRYVGELRVLRLMR